MTLRDTVQNVIRYIEENLDEELNIPAVAHIAGYSQFHFCRIFKLVVGEPVWVFIKRLRLERAAFAMINDKMSITDAAMKAGYATPSAFNKAFLEFFGHSPSKHKKSLRNKLKNAKGDFMQEPTIVTRPTVNTIRCRKIGSYEASPKEAWSELCALLGEYAATQANPNMLTTDKIEAIGIGYDDPTITEADKIRYEACLSFAKRYDNLPSQLTQSELVGGRYARALHLGSYKNMYDSWMSLFEWIRNNGYEPREGNPFEIYLNNPHDTAEENLKTELLVPIE